MSQVVSFTDYRPAARYDSDPWTEVRIDQAPEEIGPWTTIDTLALSPLDSDPTDPQSRSFTTENASDGPDLWYRVVFLDAEGNTSRPTSPVQNSSASSGRDLCTLDDVYRYVPGYTPDTDIDAQLSKLITSLSVDAYKETGREFTTRDNSAPRVFALDWWCCEERELPIGDLATDDGLTVTISEPDGTFVQTLDAGAYVALPRSRDAWEPITALQLPRIALAPAQPALLTPHRFVTITGTWGFPQIPADVVEAIAKLVIVRYATDIATTGTQLTDAMDDINLPGLLRSATQSLEDYRVPTIG